MLNRRTLLAGLATAPLMPPLRTAGAVSPDPRLAGPGLQGLGFGLAGIADWSPQLPFLDHMKSARPWIGHRPGQWGGMETDELFAGGWLNPETGWPRAIPPELDGIGTIILTDLPPGAGGAAGHYVVTWEGTGRLEIGGRAQGVRQGAQSARFDFTPGPSGVTVKLTATYAGNPLRNLRIVRADRQAALEGGAIFNPDWLARLRGVRLLRFMDWMATNNSPLRTAADLPQPADYSWMWRGVPASVMVALANELGADPWFCLPHQADDGLARTLATVVHAQLAPHLVAHVEYSNEVWNFQFTQAQWAEDQARARWGNQEWKWLQFYALRAAELMAIWAAVFIDSPQRLRRILATQTGWQGIEVDMLTAPLVVAEGRPPPVAAFDAWAVTGYFGGHIASPENAERLHDWLATSHAAAATTADQRGLRHAARRDFIARHRFDQAIATAAANLMGDAEGSLPHLLGDLLPYQAAVARKHGLQLVMYEGGTHAVATGPLLDDDEVTVFLTAFNYAPQMGDLYRHLLAGWRAISDAPFNAFVDVATPGKWGSWGSLRHLGDDNPRWQALIDGGSARLP